MLDIKRIRENTKEVIEALNKRKGDFTGKINRIITIDKELRNIQTENESMQSGRNKLSKEIGKFMGQKQFDKANEIKQKVASFKDEIAKNNEIMENLSGELKEILLSLPNTPETVVPVGEDESQNVQISK